MLANCYLELGLFWWNTPEVGIFDECLFLTSVNVHVVSFVWIDISIFYTTFSSFQIHYFFGLSLPFIDTSKILESLRLDGGHYGL